MYTNSALSCLELTTAMDRTFATDLEYFAPLTQLIPQEKRLLKLISKHLELVESEHDEHAAEIRRLLDVQTIGSQFGRVWWNECRPQSALHVACGPNIRSHVGAQLLLSDERCDVNQQDYTLETALAMCVRLVESEDDKYTKIIKLLLAHPQIKY